MRTLLLVIALGILPTMDASARNPIAEQAANAVADADAPFVMVVTFRTLPGKADAFVAAMHEPVRETAKEAGNVAYAVSRSVDDPQVFMLYEHWKSVEALDSHLAQPYLVKLVAAFEGVLAAPPKLQFFVPTP